MFRAWSLIGVLVLALSAGALPARADGKIEYSVRSDTLGDSVDYPPASRVAGEQGDVEIVFAVGSDGVPADLVVWLSSGYAALDAAALDAVRPRRYRPATRDGKPVGELKNVVFQFRIDGGTVNAISGLMTVENCIFDRPAAVQIASCGEVLALPALTQPGRVGALQKRAIVYESLHRYGDAMADNSAILAIAPNTAFALTHRGADHWGLGDYAAAADDLTQALSLTPDDNNTLYWRAQVFLQLKRYDDALSDLDHLARLGTGNPRLSFVRAQVRDAQNRYDDALREATEAVRLGPDNMFYLVFRAQLYRKHRDFTHAFADLAQAMASRPDDASIFIARCLAYAAQGIDLKAAAADCEKAVTLAPDQPLNRDARGIVYFLTGKYKPAIADNDAVLAVSPRSASILYLRGLARLKLGDKGQGRADIAAALQIDPQAADALKEFGIKD